MRAYKVFEKFIEKSDPIKDMNIGLKGAEAWAYEMASTLKNHKVTQFGGSIPVENITIVFSDESSADITGEIKVGNVTFNLYFAVRDNSYVNDESPKWVGEVSISSYKKRGFFSVKGTGKNSTPQKLIEKLSNIFDLKYKRR